MVNFDNALKAHADWKMKLRNAIDAQEKLNADAIQLDNQCELGHWLYTDAKEQTGNSEAYQECLEAHANFHKCASDVARVINDADYEYARDMLLAGTPYYKASSDVALAIYILRKELGL